ncbi:MAG: hypothetical protein HC873_14040 [Leptolyngbyaceae cyanobacterium SL_1_1]|nr:hypothetical protein [Leptolyngbyaceae cyanobacterium SL_1_1]
MSVAFSDQAEQVGQAIAPDLDSLVLRLEQIIGSETEPTPELEAMAEQIGVTLEPLLASVLIDFSTWAEQVSNPMSQTMDPFFQQHAACVGCRNYHGQVYNGNLLVCGLYPYGPNQEKCPDWESAWSA